MERKRQENHRRSRKIKGFQMDRRQIQNIPSPKIMERLSRQIRHVQKQQYFMGSPSQINQWPSGKSVAN